MDIHLPSAPEPVHAQVLAALREHVKPQPWSQFFAPDSFEKPLLLSASSARAAANARAYGGNYAILAAGCTGLTLLLTPVLALAVAVGAAAGVAHRFDVRGVGARVERRVAYPALACYTCLLLAFTPLAEMVLFGACFGAAACALHAVLHDTPESFCVSAA